MKRRATIACVARIGVVLSTRRQSEPSRTYPELSLAADPPFRGFYGAGLGSEHWGVGVHGRIPVSRRQGPGGKL